MDRLTLQLEALREEPPSEKDRERDRQGIYIERESERDISLGYICRKLVTKVN